jgi:hypothetical protein
MSSRFNGSPPPQFVMVHEGNVDEYIGHQVIYFTKGVWEISTILNVAITRGSISINSSEEKEQTTHKKRLNIPRFEDSIQVRKGRSVYVIT